MSHRISIFADNLNKLKEERERVWGTITTSLRLDPLDRSDFHTDRTIQNRAGDQKSRNRYRLPHESEGIENSPAAPVVGLDILRFLRSTVLEAKELLPNFPEAEPDRHTHCKAAAVAADSADARRLGIRHHPKRNRMTDADTAEEEVHKAVGSFAGEEVAADIVQSREVADWSRIVRRREGRDREHWDPCPSISRVQSPDRSPGSRVLFQLEGLRPYSDTGRQANAMVNSEKSRVGRSVGKVKESESETRRKSVRVSRTFCAFGGWASKENEPHERCALPEHPAVHLTARRGCDPRPKCLPSSYYYPA